MSFRFDRTAPAAARLTLIAGLACLVACCRQASHPDQHARGLAPEQGGKEAPPMPTMDPSSPEAWKQAEAIAAAAARGTLEVRSKALPFMFMADSPPAVLVHSGKVVTEKGAAAAGRYLRDLGVIQGRGPAIEDVLFVLFAFRAWPPIKDVAEESYVHVASDERLADLTARIEHDGEAARVVLHYFLSGGDAHSARDYKENDVGSVDRNGRAAAARPVARVTLLIPATGEPAWQPIEKLMWADPAP